MRLGALLLVGMLLPCGPALAGDALNRVAEAARPAERAPEDERPRILGATLLQPTDRYGHGVLGEAGEYAAMQVAVLALFGGDTFAMARIDNVRLPVERVFEDVDSSPRTDGVNPLVADLTGDGLPEVVVVESSTGSGAALAVYALDAEGRAAKLAETPAIGRRNRWLAPAGIADFDGDGRVDIAYVETPHIGGTLKLWTLSDGALVEGPAFEGVSNHRIGEDFISGGVRDCGDGPELVLADAQWTRLLHAWIVDGAWQVEPITRSVRPDLWSQALACEL